MKKLLISALALFVVGSVAAQEGLGETYNKAVAAYNSKDFASAATAFETLIDQGLDSEDLDVQGCNGQEECAGVLFPNGSYGC